MNTDTEIELKTNEYDLLDVSNPVYFGALNRFYQFLENLDLEEEIEDGKE